MAGLGATFVEALQLIGSFDARVGEIVLLSLRVSGTAVLAGACLGLPLGAALAVSRFPGRGVAVALLNGLMGLPSVVVGVAVYLALSRSGPFGSQGLLYSPTAMVIAQVVLVVPLMAAIARQVIEDAWRGYAEEFRVMGLSAAAAAGTLLLDCRHSLLVAVLAGLGRAITEVGAVMIVGGNIDGATRVMTTAIALETGKGDLPLAIALGMVIVLNLVAGVLRDWAARRFE
jgi:tungstate transport system permease protein